MPAPLVKHGTNHKERKRTKSGKWRKKRSDAGHKRKVATVTLADLEIRYKNIRKNNPKVKKCSVRECPNPRDSTRFMGETTTCAYHRLLFDYWCAEVMDPNDLYHYLKSQKGRRRAFTNWMNKIGKTSCDKIVLKLANEKINWEC